MSQKSFEELINDIKELDNFYKNKKEFNNKIYKIWPDISKFINYIINFEDIKYNADINSYKKGQIIALKYIVRVIEPHFVPSKDYKAAIEDVKICAGASIERLLKDEPMESLSVPA